ncbi:hypothetical protein NKDENANG_02680 [Candidatus Entotheonellaceae bacterium PAL068K]
MVRPLPVRHFCLRVGAESFDSCGAFWRHGCEPVPDGPEALARFQGRLDTCGLGPGRQARGIVEPDFGRTNLEQQGWAGDRLHSARWSSGGNSESQVGDRELCAAVPARRAGVQSQPPEDSGAGPGCGSPGNGARLPHELGLAAGLAERQGTRLTLQTCILTL